MSLPEIAIRRPVFAWMIMFGLIIFGAVSFKRLGVSQMPDVDFPVVNVAVTWEGAAPEIMEAEIVDKLEQVIISVQGIREVSSTMRQSTANITIEFDISRDVDAALQEVQSAVSHVKLPKGVDPPTLSKNNPDDSPIIWLGVSSTRSLHDLIAYIDLHLRDQFQILPGVGEIVLSGYSDRNLRIWIDAKKLDQYELTVTDVENAIGQQHLETAAGIIENSKQELNVRMMGEGITPDKVGDILIAQRGGKPIYNAQIHVRDVARVEDGLADIRRISRISGQPGVGLGIKKQRGGNAVAVGQVVKKKVEELAKTLPNDIKVVVNFDSTKFVEDSVDDTEFTLILSALATALVCFLFLGSWASTFNILLSIPTSIVGSFTIIYFMGFTLNFFTLLGLALAIGIVVDDAIMVLENIYRHMEMGKSPIQAALDGATEISFAAIAASIAVIAIFLPVAFMKGIIGKFFFQFGVTITAAVALSLLEAVTLTPMRCSQLMSSSISHGWFVTLLDKIFDRMAGGYRKILALCLRWRLIVVGLSLALFVGSLYLSGFLRKEFIPAQDQSMFLMRFETPIGSSLEFTSKKILEVEDFLSKRPEVKRYFVAVGGFQGGEVNTANVFVSMKDKRDRSITQAESMNLARIELSKIPDLKVFVQDLSMRGFTAQRGFPVEFNIRGDNWDVLRDKSTEIKNKLIETGLVTDVNTDYRLGQPEVRVWPLREEAMKRGVTIESLSNTINTAIGGVRQGEYTNDGRRYDVRIRLDADQRLSADDINNLKVRNEHGELVPLKDVVKLETVPTLQTITRKNRERSISISANIAPGKSQADALEAAQRIGKEILPEGYRVFLGGGAQTFIESFQSLYFVLALGVVVAYMVLASQFNSFLHPVIVLLALPFSITGAFAGLYLASQSLNLYSMIGIILLMGIVKKNSILLVEFANKMRFERGMPLTEAILEAAPVRLRPILMTSLATIAAALPPALALGPGAESRIPMAVTILGGVIVSTGFTLLVVPCAYSLAARLERKRIVIPELSSKQSIPAH